jgi:hypothetical protein
MVASAAATDSRVYDLGEANLGEANLGEADLGEAGAMGRRGTEPPE